MKKNVFILSIATLVIIIAAVNLYLAKTDLASSLRSSRLINLQALTSETSTGEASAGKKCKTEAGKPVVMDYQNCDGRLLPYSRKIVHKCEGSDGGECKPGNSYQYFNCYEQIIDTDDSSRSIAYCPIK
jgi:hypothetical protein